jgi:hypothetical protein
MRSIGAEALGIVVNVVVVVHEPTKPSTILAPAAVGGLPFQPKPIFQGPSNPITLTPISFNGCYHPSRGYVPQLRVVFRQGHNVFPITTGIIP